MLPLDSSQATCSTGKGTAEKIKQMLDEILADQLIDDVSVLTMSVVGMNDKINELNEEYRIIATTIAPPRCMINAKRLASVNFSCRSLANRSQYCQSTPITFLGLIKV